MDNPIDMVYAIPRLVEISSNIWIYKRVDRLARDHMKPLALDIFNTLEVSKKIGIPYSLRDAVALMRLMEEVRRQMICNCSMPSEEDL